MRNKACNKRNLHGSFLSHAQAKTAGVIDIESIAPAVFIFGFFFVYFRWLMKETKALPFL